MKHKLSGRKLGGKTFPRIDLSDSVGYAKKLVSKTFVGAQPSNIILKGVFNNAGSAGKERASALRQFKLLDGPDTEMSASQLAKDITAATPESRQALLRTACLSPKVFKDLYDTFKGDAVSSAKVRQQAIKLGVHPENADRCTTLFLESLKSAGLARDNGDQVDVLNEGAVATVAAADADEQRADTEIDTNQAETQQQQSGNVNGEAPLAAPVPPPAVESLVGGASARSVIHINVNLDSSLDTDKLQKQLELLRKFGAL